MTAPHLIDALEQLDDQYDTPPRRQVGQLFLVTLENQGEPIEVHTTNRDMIAWEKTAARHKEWPTSSQAPIFATTFVVWSAARRAGQTALAFEAFVEVVLEVEKLEVEVAADPTR